MVKKNITKIDKKVNKKIDKKITSKTPAGMSDESFSVLVGCVLIGMGVGFYFNNLLPFMFIGLGIGFLILVFMKKKINN